MKFDAPKELTAWLVTEEKRLSSHGIACDVKRPHQVSDSSKASVALSASAVVGSLTIWATGMVEFIAMNTRTGADLAARDVEATSEAELKAALSRFIDEFVELAEIEHE